MSLHVLAVSTLAADPVSRTSAAGKLFATALLRTACEDADAMLLSLIAFSTSAAETLLAHSKGDSLAVAGRAKPSSWMRDGEEKHGLSVVVDKVLSPYQVDVRRKKAAQQAQDGFPAEAGIL